MADTQRSKSALQTILADNSTKAISPQDLRDLMESCHFSYGSMYISSSAATTISVAGTYVKAAGTTTDVNLHRFDGKVALGVNNRLKYTGTPNIHVHGAASFTTTMASGTNKVMGFAAYHYDDSAASGSTLTHSVVQANHVSTTPQSSAIHFDVMLSTNDYIEFWVTNTTDTTSPTVTHMYLFMMGMFM